MEAHETLARLDALIQEASRYWNGEAEIVRAFFSQPRTRQEHERWLRLQTYKEHFGSGIGDREGLLAGPLKRLSDLYPKLDAEVDRHEYGRILDTMVEEFHHYTLMADLLEEVSGQKVTPQSLLEGYQDFPADKELTELRYQYKEREGDLGEFAVDFTEGGRAAIFFAGLNLSGDPFLERVAQAFKVIFDDEVGHQEYGAQGLAEVAKTEEDWRKVHEMVITLSKLRVRMRDEQFGHPIPPERLQELLDGKAEPLRVEVA